MKAIKHLLSILALTIIVGANAQTIFNPTNINKLGFNFQGYAVDPDGKALDNKEIIVKFTIKTAAGADVYTEEVTTTTDAYGVFIAIIGSSSEYYNNEFYNKVKFSGNEVYSLKVEVKKTIGGTFITINQQPFTAVPYAKRAENGVPVGTIIAWAGNGTVPDGWEACDGKSVSKDDPKYAELFKVIGTDWGSIDANGFTIPDLRGVFLRGTGSRAAFFGETSPDKNEKHTPSGNYVGDRAGGYQGPKFNSHKHNVSVLEAGEHKHDLRGLTGDNADWSQYTIRTAQVKVNINDPFNSADANNQSQHNLGGAPIRPAGKHTHSVSEENAGGNETRPANASVNYIIKL